MQNSLREIVEETIRISQTGGGFIPDFRGGDLGSLQGYKRQGRWIHPLQVKPNTDIFHLEMYFDV